MTEETDMATRVQTPGQAVFRTMSALVLACGACSPTAYPEAGVPAGTDRRCAPERELAGFDVLQSPAPRAPSTLRGVCISREEYSRFVRWGEWWFRSETFGGERTTTDVAGLFGAEIEIPCAASVGGGAPCRERVSAFPYLVQALDALDGVAGNLFSGNGGKLGKGYTSDLVIEFPKGTTLAGLPVPERLHTGLDVDAGYAWPVGVVAVKAPDGERHLPYLVEPSALGVGPAPEGKVRLGITCALCHYSLDIDKDGRADMRSTRWGEETPGSRWRPEDAWGVGNQDLHFGWLFGLTRNPLMGFTVLSGPVGKNTPEDALEWVRWVRDNYRRAPATVRREVIRGMLVQPRGYADDSPNALHDPNQLPVLYTYRNWPYNFDGSFSDASDRNNGVWTGAIDFTGLIALARDRSGGRQAALYWEPTNVYSLLSAEEYADMMVDQSPAVRFDPNVRNALKHDILGYSDGIPGLLHPDNVVVMKNELGSLPSGVLNHPENVKNGRIRRPDDYGGDARNRGSMMVLFGTRVRTTAAVRKQFDVDALLSKYPKLNADDFQSDVVSLMLDWLTPPSNVSPLLAASKALVPEGYEVFKQAGCAGCHAGPYLTDNRMHRLYDRRKDEIGIAAASTAGFRSLGRGTGPALGTAPYRSLANRPLQLFVAPPYDAATGLAVAPGGTVSGLLGTRAVGYKAITLRYLWGSAPYLHDGGVGVALRPAAPPAEDDLKALLSRPSSHKFYGMASLLQYREQNQTGGPWPNAALSLQALVLESERAKVIADNRAPVMSVPGNAADNPLGVPPRVSLEALGVDGSGHDFYIDDVPGGNRVTALVAFLLALDDAPGELP
jgi:mono/diheme cytochrome c family protein